jgi:hypothetical protein
MHAAGRVAAAAADGKRKNVFIIPVFYFAARAFAADIG